METMTISCMLRRAAERHAELSCFLHDDRSVTFAEFDREVDRLAAGLLHLGIGKGDHVGIWLPNTYEWLLSFCATARIGAVTVPINTRYKTEEAGYVIERADAKALIMLRRMWKSDYYGMLCDLAPGLPDQPPGALDLPELPSLRSVVVIGDEAPEGTVSFTSIMQDDPKTVREAEARVFASELMLICFTSGSTGKPKGVMHNHGVIEQATRVGRSLYVEPGDRVLAHMPFYHSAGLYMALITSLNLGAALVPMVQWDARDALDLIERHKITMFGGIPTHFYDVCALPDLDSYDLSSLKAAWIGGSAVMKETFERIMRSMRLPRLLSTYGMTENTISTSFNDWDDPIEYCCSNKAPLLSPCEVRVVDPETLKEVPRGTEGEIWCRGETVMMGYYKDPDATADAITSEGWLRTGDLGVLDDDSYLTITGRLKEQLKIGGTNTSPIEIEQMLAAHPDVKSSVVVGVPDERMGEVAWAFVELINGADASAEDIIAHCSRSLADYKVPRQVHFVTEFPLTATGKVQRNEVAKTAQGMARSG